MRVSDNEHLETLLWAALLAFHECLLRAHQAPHAEAPTQEVLAVKQQFPGNLHQGVVDIQKQVSRGAGAQPGLDGRGQELAVQRGALRFDLLPGSRSERAATVGHALHQGHHGVDGLLHGRHGDLEIFVVAHRFFFPWPAFVGAELEPFALAGDIQGKDFRGPRDHPGATQ